MARAYVLIETAIGKTQPVVEALRQVPGVKSADAITGKYDAIAVIEGEPHEIGTIVMKSIHSTEGVKRTMTCFVVE